MRDQGLGSWPVRRRRLSPAHVAFVQGDTRRSYAALDDRTRHLAAALRDLGVQRGDRVAYLGPNDPTLLETLFATTALGGVFVPLNWRLTVPELAYIAADCGATVLVHAAAMADAAAAVAADGSTALPRLVELGPAFEGMATGGGAGGDVPAPIDTPVALDDPAVIVYKCGTIVLTGAFDPDSVLELIARHRVTVMFGVPSMFNAMAQAPAFASADLSSLRRLLCGGAPVPLSTIRTYLDRDIPFLQGYGMTETSPGALFLGAEHAADKAGSAGVASFFTDVRVVRPDGREVVPGEKGEVVVAGPNVMRGYWNRPEATAGVMDGEWFRSGDVAVVDDDGYVTIVDRMKDVIISGGENIYPAEVEDVIYGHPDVAECAVIGVPDERWGEVGRVIVVRRAGAALDERGLLEHLDGRLARFKLPRSVVFTDRLPRSGAGKVLKADLRAEFGAP